MKKPLHLIPIVGTTLKKTGENVKKHGIQKAMKIAGETLGARILTQMEKDTLEVLKKHPGILVVGRHYSEADPIALFAALPSRRNIFLIIQNSVMGIHPHFDKHLIPVYIKNNQGQESNKLSELRSKILEALNPTENLSPEEEHEKNKESIRKASRKIDKGGMIIIFPGQTRERWYDGVGYMASGVRHKNKCDIVLARIEGTSKLDTMRIIPGIKHLLPEIKIAFSEPIKLKELGTDKPKEITKVLQKKYENWVKTLDARY